MKTYTRRAALIAMSAVGYSQPRTASITITTRIDDVEIFIDGISRGVVNPGRPLVIRGIAAGEHTIRAVKPGHDLGGPWTIAVEGWNTFHVPPHRPPEPPPPDIIIDDPPAAPAPVGGTRLSGRALLPTVQPEEAGYGLYTYLLFGRRPLDRTSDRYARYIRCLESWLEIEDTSAVRAWANRRDINVTYLPVTENQSGAAPQRLLEFYDFARAQRILRLTSAASSDGPVLLSSRQPLSRATTLPSEYLLQDLSTVPPPVVRLWVKHFISQAERERFWERQTRDQFILELRTYVARGGIAIDQVGTALAAIVWRF